MDRSEEDRAIREVVDRLTKQFPQLATEEVTRAVDESRPEFDRSPIRGLRPLFVERREESLAPAGRLVTAWASPRERHSHSQFGDDRCGHCQCGVGESTLANVIAPHA